MRPPSPPRPLAFPTLDSLAAFLGSRLPASALASWGTAPGTKTLLNLFLELSQGECVLISAAAAAAPPSQQQQQQQQHPVVRAVHVASVRIRNGRGALLMETGQLLSDGTLRSRGGLRPLSEKMRPGETPEAVRGSRSSPSGGGNFWNSSRTPLLASLSCKLADAGRRLHP